MPVGMQLVGVENPWVFLPWEVSLNALGAIAVTSPVWWKPFSRDKLLLAMAVGVLIDVDHAVSAHSIDFEAMIGLDGRPATHSLLFAGLLGGIIATIKDRSWGWLVIAALLSHLVRDSSGSGTPLLFPYSEQLTLPWAIYPLGLVALFATSWALRSEQAVS